MTMNAQDREFHAQYEETDHATRSAVDIAFDAARTALIEHLPGFQPSNTDPAEALVAAIMRYVVEPRRGHSAPADTAPPAGLRPYTVLLLRPDYLANEYGHDTYMTSVLATDHLHAQALARAEASSEDSDGDGFDPPHEDYHVLMTIAGHHDDLGA